MIRLLLLQIDNMQKTINNFLLCASLMTVVVCNGGCGAHDKSGHDATVKFGENNEQLVKQFNALAPADGRSHWISYYDGYGNVPIWNSFGKLHKRYKLTMQFRISLDRRSREFSPKEEPRFYIREVTEVEVPESENAGNGYKFGEQFTFGIKEWKKLVENDGDFSAIGIELKKNSPVANFESVKR